MKKIVLFSLAIVFASCLNKRAYTVEGIFTDEDYNGKMAYLQQVDPEDETITLDSTVIKDGHFLFRGIAPDKVELRFINIDEDLTPVMIALEPGTITISYDLPESPIVRGAPPLSSIVRGTPLNDSYQAFADEIGQIFDQINEKYLELLENVENEPEGSEIGEFTEYQDQMEDIIKKKVYTFLRPNMDNALGEFIFMVYSYYLDSGQIIDLLATTSPEFRSRDDIQDIEKSAIAQEAVSIGKPFIDIKGKNLNGQEVALSDYAGKGKIVLIDFWASWCRPCIHSLPEVVKLYKKYKDKGFEIVGVSLDEEREAWANATQKHQVTWPQLSNLQGWQDEAAAVYGVSAIPHTILIDKDGIICEKNITPEILSKKIEELLK